MLISKGGFNSDEKQSYITCLKIDVFIHAEK